MIGCVRQEKTSAWNELEGDDMKWTVWELAGGEDACDHWLNRETVVITLAFEEFRESERG